MPVKTPPVESHHGQVCYWLNRVREAEQQQLSLAEKEQVQQRLWEAQEKLQKYMAKCHEQSQLMQAAKQKTINLNEMD